MDTNQTPDPQVAAIVKALAMTENGGKVPTESKAGQSGEMKSIFQYTPGTWKMYSKQVLGKEVPLDRGSETIVTYGKVHDMLQQGLSPEEIASVWNSGKPDAYLQNHVGTNKYGVHFDTPGYVKKFSTYLKGDSVSPVGSEGSSEQPTSQQMPSQIAMRPSPLPLQTQGSAPQSNTLPSLMQRNIKSIKPSRSL